MKTILITKKKKKGIIKRTTGETSHRRNDLVEKQLNFLDEL